MPGARLRGGAGLVCCGPVSPVTPPGSTTIFRFALSIKASESARLSSENRSRRSSNSAGMVAPQSDVNLRIWGVLRMGRTPGITGTVIPAAAARSRKR